MPQFIGGIDEYLASRKMDNIDALQVKNTVVKEKVASKPKISDYESRKNEQKLERKLRSTVQKLEQEIQVLEEKLSALNETISQSENYDPALITEYQTINQKLERTMKSWENESLQLESLGKS